MGLMIISSTSTFAQLSYGVKAGLNFSKMKMKVDGEIVDDIKFNPGVNLGVYADYGFSDMLAIETGLTFEKKGFKMKNEETSYGVGVEMTSKFNIVYATIPVQARLNFGNFYAMAGPYVGIGLTGKHIVKVIFDDETEKNDDSIEFGNEAGKSDVKRFDFGFGIGAGYEITDNLGVRLGYDLGMANLQPGGDNNYSARNGSISISATYKF
ncbi:MAG: PorT family protein [Salinivirgaceae bacterium]|nr:PorT family protein [Salinivirgaceae bacterium]